MDGHVLLTAWLPVRIVFLESWNACTSRSPSHFANDFFVNVRHGSVTKGRTPNC
jgi:hypothetical protein